MNDIKYYRFKEHMLQRAMELWGIQDRSSIDPIVELFIDVFAYEISKIHHEIRISDNQLLDRLSRILVNKKWSLPMPAHSLLKMEPESESEVEVTKINRFYTSKRIKGGKSIEVGFSPIYSQSVIKAEISYLISGQNIARKDKLGLINSEQILTKEDRFLDYELLVGIKIEDSLLEKLKLLHLCILPEDASLSSYLSVVEACTLKNDKLSIAKNPSLMQTSRNSHYEQDILDYYSDYMYVVDIDNASKKQASLEEMGIPSKYMNILDDETSYYWIKLKFPENFSQKKLSQVSIYLNAIPVVNKDLQKLEYNLKNKGRIVPLNSKPHNYFLNIESLKDNFGKLYCNIEDSFENSREGTFSLYFGELEKFDNRSAREIVNRALQALREEGSSFYSLDADSIESRLSSVGNILDELEQILRTKDIDNLYNGGKAYLLTTPMNGAFNYGVEYWVTSADLANGIPMGTSLHPYKTDAFKETSVRLITNTLGGNLRKNEQDRINSLRYGLLAKDRIVSKEDIKSFILHSLGDRCDDIIISNGVEVSSLITGGLIRTVKIEIMLNDTLGEANSTRLANFIEKAIEKKSVLRSNYRVKITKK